MAITYEQDGIKAVRQIIPGGIVLHFPDFSDFDKVITGLPATVGAFHAFQEICEEIKRDSRYSNVIVTEHEYDVLEINGIPFIADPDMPPDTAMIVSGEQAVIMENLDDEPIVVREVHNEGKLGDSIWRTEDRIRKEVATIAAGFGALVEMQMRVNATIPGELDGSPQATRDYIHALMVELGELSNALRVKAWKPDDVLTNEDIDASCKEFADVIAFFAVNMVNIARRLGARPEDFAYAMAHRYGEVSRENIERHGRK